MKRDNENAQKTHYFLDPNKRKKRSPLQESQFVSCNGTPFTNLFNGLESDAATTRRYDMYSNVWQRQLAKIDAILNNANLDLFHDLNTFISATSAINQLSERSFYSNQNSLPVGFLQLSSNTANNLRILQELSKFLIAKSHEDQKLIYKVINISSKACSNIKSTLRDLVRQFLDLKEDDPAANGYVNYDLDILEEWCLDHEEIADKLRIVIIIQDTNSINNHVLNQLLRVLYSYASRLPLRLVMGLSSSNISSWINVNLSNENRILINGLKFKSSDNKTLGYRIINELFLDFDSLLATPLLSTILLQRFESANNSIDGLVSQVKLSYMIHFYSSPLAILSGEVSNDDDLDHLDNLAPSKLYIDALRKLPSFKIFIERKIFSDNPPKEQIRSYLTEDKSLIELFKETKADITEYKLTIFNMVNLLSKFTEISKFEIYKLIVSGRASEFKDLQIDEKEVSFAHIDPHLAKFKGNLSEKESFLEYLSVPSLDNFVFHETFSFNGGPPSHEKPIFEENFTNLMIQLVRPNLRASLESGLDDCTRYLQAPLTRANEKFSHTTLNVLFRVYKEAPVAINIYDFYMAFKQSLDRDLVPCETDEEWDKISYSWFIQNCFELVMLGLLKEKPKGDYLEKAVWKSI